MIDFNNSNRINIDSFIQVIGESEIPFKMSETQQIFDLYDLNNNGQCFYLYLIDDLKVYIFNNLLECVS